MQESEEMKSRKLNSALFKIQRDYQLSHGAMCEDKTISGTLEAENIFKSRFQQDLVTCMALANQLHQCFVAVRTTAKDVVKCSKTKLDALVELKQSQAGFELQNHLYQVNQTLEQMDENLLLTLRKAHKALQDNIQKIVEEFKKKNQAAFLQKIDLKLANYFDRISLVLFHRLSGSLQVTCLRPDDEEYKRCCAGVIAAANRSYFSGTQYDHYRISCVVKLRHDKQKQHFNARNQEGKVKGLFCSLEQDAKKFDLGDPAEHMMDMYLQLAGSAFTPTLPMTFSRMSTLSGDKASLVEENITKFDDDPLQREGIADGALSTFLKKRQIRCLALCRVNILEDIGKQSMTNYIRELIKINAEIEINDPSRILPEYLIFYTLEKEAAKSASLLDEPTLNPSATKDRVVLAPGGFGEQDLSRLLSLAPPSPIQQDNVEQGSCIDGNEGHKRHVPGGAVVCE
ncbi:hypothetical protein GUITHDRAFT_114524 [Guillardia theta CCMP2712]|uniref:Uncharacterized protein n=2 Tax=Guillardia theta TaxID=55529 RepID=L1ISX8_GUITC|nr:hypothetical protein GUITHDRAFT_114524 [Guillardia theta CCMP2712]EKX39323.1 hypothetical protein GUITHDRAFT_114524 [Guillardia theta CCMP2712]|eukprot:XP_005826303.1 hypothetical protein GUITHDRAFT_114524 [Guillardia theta CCMP2712]